MSSDDNDNKMRTDNDDDDNDNNEAETNEECDHMHRCNQRVRVGFNFLDHAANIIIQ